MVDISAVYCDEARTHVDAVINGSRFERLRIDLPALYPSMVREWIAAGNSPGDPPIDYRAKARAALDASDVTVLRCYEALVDVPEDWRIYRAALRAIVASGHGPIPDAPPFPAGT